MEKILKKGHHGVIAQLNSIQVSDHSSPTVPPNLQLVLDKYHQVFEIPKDLPPSRGEHDHNIPLLPGSHPPMYIPTGIHLLKKMK
jgi:hypothetical protein